MAEKLTNIGACVFDAYGTLFDVAGAAAACRDDLGDQWIELADIWRAKQLSYTWLRSLMDEYVGFWQVTEDALDFALAQLSIADPPLRRRLMALYEELPAYDEVPGMLAALKERGLTTAILSNGTARMLGAAVRSAGIGDYLDDLISVEKLAVYKPHPAVYQLAVDELALAGDTHLFHVGQCLGRGRGR